MARIADSIANLVWMQSEDGYKHRNPPEMILPKWLGMSKEEPEAESSGCDSAEDFKNALQSFDADYGV